MITTISRKFCRQVPHQDVVQCAVSPRIRARAQHVHLRILSQVHEIQRHPQESSGIKPRRTLQKLDILQIYGRI